MLKSITGTPLTRPADTTAYASGDLVASSTTAGSIVVPTLAAVLSEPVSTVKAASIRRVKLKKSGAVLTNAAFRVHFYKNAPTFTNGDNGVWLSIEAGYLGFVDVTIDKAFSDASAGFASPAVNANIVVNTPQTSNRIYWVLEARAAYTPASAEVFTVTADIDRE